jgi:hypothetical protein
MWAYSDESERASLMLVGVLLLPAADVPAARRDLRGLLLPGQRRVHTANESPRRRRLLLDVVARLRGEAIVFMIRRPVGLDRVAARHLLLVATAGLLADRNVTSWVLDGQDPAQAARDRRSIAGVLGESHPLVYDHRAGYEEPLLWAIDALVWAVGAGGEWLRRVDELVDRRALRP